MQSYISTFLHEYITKCYVESYKYSVHETMLHTTAPMAYLKHPALSYHLSLSQSELHLALKHKLGSYSATVLMSVFCIYLYVNMKCHIRQAVCTNDKASQTAAVTHDLVSYCHAMHSICCHFFGFILQYCCARAQNGES